MDLHVAVVVVGIVLLIGLAVAIGLVGVTQRRSTARAWRAIAAERRRNWAERQRLARTAERCRDCPYRPDPG
ncbi:hypothetical protein [Pseudonocardia zijingensis]|uniref:Uncharacterized protein n=1 Tax=Pseudonocardia zijingensis TaxID=153376 RepID=A0ABN1NFG4_9PSEU